MVIVGNEFETKEKKFQPRMGFILQLRPVSNVVLLPCRSQKFDSTNVTAVARRLKLSRSTAVHYAAVARWNFLLFLGLKTLKK